MAAGQGRGDKAPTMTIERWHQQRLPDKPTVAPALSVPIAPLGFTAPGALYFGQRYSMASLDFIDENRLLFTFRVPGLIRREPTAQAEGDASDEHHIRALVIALPAGNVVAEALWTQHDRERYLWMLKDGHFLVRDGKQIREGDSSLALKPYLEFPGAVVGLELDPAQQYLVTDSHEPAAPRPGEVPEPATAAAVVSQAGDSNGNRARSATGAPGNDQTDMVVRIIERSSGKVMLFSRVRSAIHLPIRSDGYLEALRARGAAWELNLNAFTGGVTPLAQVESACKPSSDFVTERLVLAVTCTRAGDHRLAMVTADGHRLWEEPSAEEPVWPLLSFAAGGSRVMRESLVVSHSVNAREPLGPEDVKGQLVEVFDAANGNVSLAASASPVLDAGGNAAISPSGQRVAIISDGAIRIFDLPPAPAISDTDRQARR